MGSLVRWESCKISDASYLYPIYKLKALEHYHHVYLSGRKVVHDHVILSFGHFYHNVRFEFFLPSICNEYEKIKEVLSSLPSDTENLVKVQKFLLEVSTTMNTPLAGNTPIKIMPTSVKEMFENKIPLSKVILFCNLLFITKSGRGVYKLWCGGFLFQRCFESQIEHVPLHRYYLQG